MEVFYGVVWGGVAASHMHEIDSEKSSKKRARGSRGNGKKKRRAEMRTKSKPSTNIVLPRTA